MEQKKEKKIQCKKENGKEQEIDYIVKLIARIGDYYHVQQKELTYGLCEPSIFSKGFVAGGKGNDKLVIEALLQRLGKVTREFSFFLDASKYQLFEIRENIRSCLEQNELDEAERLLAVYRKKSNSQHHLHHQFALLFETYILDKRGVDTRLLYDKTEEALRITIPDFELVHAGKFFYSEIELLLAFRIAFLKMKLGQKEEAVKGYEELYALMEQERYRDGELIYMFAPVIYHLAKYYYTAGQYQKAYNISQVGLERIPQKNRILYLSELFYINADAMVRTKFGRENVQDFEGLREKTLNYQYYKVFRALFEKFYPAWDADTYYLMYREYNVLPIGKIIKQRRLLYGLTQEELIQADPTAKDRYGEKLRVRVEKNNTICDIDTLSRLENGKYATHRSIERELMRKLRLLPEYCYAEFVTADWKVMQKVKEAKTHYLNLHLEEAEKCLSEIKKINEEKSCLLNEQWIRTFEYRLKVKKEKKVPENELEILLQLLDYTFPKEKWKECKCYLFTGEVEVLSSIVNHLRAANEIEQAAGLLQRIKKGYELVIENSDSLIYQKLVLEQRLESFLASTGNFKEANVIARKAIVFDFRHDILGGIATMLYEEVWNIKKEGRNVDEKWCCFCLRAAYALSCQRVDFSITKYIENFCEKNYPDKNILSGLR